MRPSLHDPCCRGAVGTGGRGMRGEMVRPSGTWSRCPLVLMVCRRFPAPCNGAQCSTFPRSPA
eukprot:5108493-Pyramimonas_sp.AAC.1